MSKPEGLTGREVFVQMDLSEVEERFFKSLSESLTLGEMELIRKGLAKAYAERELPKKPPTPPDVVALVQSIELFEFLIANPGSDKREFVGSFDINSMMASCPLCQYVRNNEGLGYNCTSCPMYNRWPKAHMEGCTFTCQDTGTAFMDWEQTGSLYDLALILKAFNEVLEEKQ
jgi:hypothetical protein